MRAAAGGQGVAWEGSVVGKGEPYPVFRKKVDDHLRMDADTQVDALVFLDFPPVSYNFV